MLSLRFMKYKAVSLSSIGFEKITTIALFGNADMSIKLQMKPSEKSLLILTKIAMRETIRQIQAQCKIRIAVPVAVINVDG